jgi:hypothetical protein
MFCEIVINESFLFRKVSHPLLHSDSLNMHMFTPDTFNLFPFLTQSDDFRNDVLRRMVLYKFYLVFTQIQRSPVSKFGLSWINASNRYVTSGFRQGVDQNCVLLGYYVARRGNIFETFRDTSQYLLQGHLKMEQIGYNETSVINSHLFSKSHLKLIPIGYFERPVDRLPLVNKNTLKKKPIICPETSVRTYY